MKSQPDFIALREEVLARVHYAASALGFTEIDFAVPLLWTIDGLMSAAECAALLATAREAEWLPATTGTIIYADGGASTQLM